MIEHRYIAPEHLGGATSTVYNQDCMEGMKQYPDNYFDLALTDPPYNVGREYNEYNDNLTEEDYELWCLGWLGELLRVSRTVCMTVGYKNLKFWFNQSPKHMIVWVKPNQNSPSPLGGFNVYEPILFWGDLQKRIGHDSFSSNIALQPEASFHDCPKHLPSWEKILNMIVSEGAKVLDPFLGSGTTRICCYKQKMEFVGYELDPDYFKAGNKRFTDFTNQTRLF